MMKNLFAHAILIGGLFFMSSCEQTKKSSELLPVIDIDKMNVELVTLTGKRIQVDGAFIDMAGAPIRLHNKKNLLFLRNAAYQQEDEFYFIVYSLLENKIIKKFGARGQGPYDFVMPRLHMDENQDEFVTYIFDNGTGNHYRVDNDFSLELLGKYNERKIFENMLGGFYIVNDSTIYSITHQNKENYSLYKEVNDGEITLVYDFSLLPDVTFFYAYYGSLSLNPDKNRMLYAYKFFREIHLLDMDGNLIKKVQGKDKNRDKSDGMDEWLDHPHTPMYYGASFSTDNYVYVSYSEESTLSGIMFEGKGKDYLLLEQYDWDANLIRRIKLDKSSMSFIVSSDDSRLYLLASGEDDPLYVYNLTN